MSHLSNLLREFREGAEMSYDEMAAATDIAKSNLWLIEHSDDPNPTLSTLRALADIMQISLDELVGA